VSVRRPLLALIPIAGISIPAIDAQALSLGSLSISVPPTATLGTAAIGSTPVSGSLGNIKVTDTRTLGSGWTTTVTSSSFTAPGLTVIPNSAVTYVSGLANEVTGLLVTPVPGSLTGVTLGTGRTAFAAVATGSNTVRWNPTITVALPSNSLSGTYSGTITHSVS
jgi:hypothetical protein